MKLMDSVYMVGSGTAGFSMTNAFDSTVYLVDGKDELALIDAGVGVQPERIIKQIERDGFDPAQIGKILLTHGHGDHAGRRVCAVEGVRRDRIRDGTGGRVYSERRYSRAFAGIGD